MESKESCDPESECETSGREAGNGVDDWKFHVAASSSRRKNAAYVASDVIGTIDFNRSGDFFATGGIARKIRICSYSKMIGEGTDQPLGMSQSNDEWDFSDEEDPPRRSVRVLSRSRSRDYNNAAVKEILTPGKLGSVKWAADGSDVIGCGDYDGVVMEWSVEHGHTVCERYEHSGQRVWSFDYCKSAPHLSASSSADGTVRVWSKGVEKSIIVLKSDRGNSLCSAEFSPVTETLIAVASADSNVYLYDLRKPESYFLKLRGHDRAVSYVRFMGMHKLVSASTDNTLKLWDISSPVMASEGDGGFQCSGKRSLSGNGAAYLERTFASHVNNKHFVGLSLHSGAGLLACGSENNEVFLYRNSSTVPVLNHEFPDIGMVYHGEVSSGQSYVGAVCWREQSNPYTLVAANSDGIVEVLQGTRF